jgi:predicted transcriptional regulator
MITVKGRKMDALVIEKEKIKEMLSEFPENVVIEDFIDRIIITAKIEKALDQFEKGDYMTSEELDEEIKKWD